MNIRNLSALALRQRRRKLLSDLPPLDRVLRGSLTETYKRCGRPNCHCRDGPGHGPKRYLVISQPGGRPHREYVPNAACEQVTEWLDNFRRLRDALNEICAINAELLRQRLLRMPLTDHDHRNR